MIVLHEAVLPKYTVNKNDLRTLSLINEEEKKEKEEEEKEKKIEKEGEENQKNIFDIDDDDIEEHQNKIEDKKEE